jgi:hypothetical protein
VINLRAIKPGDTVLVAVGHGPAAMPFLVSKVDADLIYVTDDEGVAEWTYCRDSGWEIDEDLGLGPQYGLVGARLAKVIPA